MDEELYSALVGDVPQGDRLRLVANILRNKDKLGQLGQLSGDRVLAPLGQNISAAAQRDVQTLGQRRDKATDDAQTKAYQDWQMDYTTRNADRNYALQAAQNAETARYNRDRLALERQKAEADGTAPKKYRQMTAGERDKMANRADLLTNIRSLYDQFKDSYAQPFGAGGLSGIGNTAVAYGLVPAESKKDAQNWWAQWQLIYTLPERNAKFGATLTENEQRAWASVDINPNMDAEQIKTKLRQFFNKLSGETKRRLEMYDAGGFDPGESAGALTGVDMTPYTSPTTAPGGGPPPMPTRPPNVAPGLPGAAAAARPAAPAAPGMPDISRMTPEQKAQYRQMLMEKRNAP